MVACGDREDFLQFLRMLPSRREGNMRRNCKRESDHHDLPVLDIEDTVGGGYHGGIVSGHE